MRQGRKSDGVLLLIIFHVTVVNDQYSPEVAGIGQILKI